MSSSDRESRVPLRVRAADEGTEIFLVDSSFRRLATSIGELTESVEPGLYKVRFRSGEVMEDHLIEVPAQLPAGQSELQVEGRPLGFASPLPLTNTRTTHEFHEMAWSLASEEPDRRLGDGSRLFVLVRDSRRKPGTHVQHRPWTGLALCTAEGDVLLDFDRASHCDADLGYAAANLEVRPGTYVLRVDTEIAGQLEMPVVTCRGWQTQIVLRSHTYSRVTAGGHNRVARRADLASATALMVRPGHRPDPRGEQERLTEMARIGLAQGRLTIQPDQLSSMLWAKYENPMLGIYGAHLLLRHEQNPDTLREVANNLKTLTPDHPDVAALELALDRDLADDRSRRLRFPTPPMLTSSWRLVVDASAKEPAIVPERSLTARVAINLIGGGTWVMWRKERTAPRKRASRRRPPLPTPRIHISPQSERVSFRRSIYSDLFEPQSRGLMQWEDPSREIVRGTEPDTDDPSRLIASMVNRASDAEAFEQKRAKFTLLEEAFSRELSVIAALPPGEQIAALARRVRVPPASVTMTLESLARKLGVKK